VSLTAHQQAMLDGRHGWPQQARDAPADGGRAGVRRRYADSGRVGAPEPFRRVGRRARTAPCSNRWSSATDASWCRRRSMCCPPIGEQ
jgi:hypothetical protein